MFNFLDIVVLIAYFLVMAGIGFYFSKKNKNFGDFMFGAKKMPWLAVGISMIATSVSASTFLGNPADAFKNNMSLLMLNIGSVIGIIIVGTVFIPRYKNSNIKSAYELLEIKFSRSVRLTAAIFYSFHVLLRTGVLIYGPALVIKTFFNIPMMYSIILMAVIAVLYTSFGGIKAVTWTDVIQFIIFFGCGLLVIYFTTSQTGGFVETLKLATEAGKTKVWDFSFDPSNARNILSAGFIYIIFEVAIRGCDQQFVQRYISCKNNKEANYSSIASVFLGMLVSIIFFFLGASLYVFYKVKVVQTLPVDIGINQIFPHFILTNLPNGLKGLLVAAIMAAAMSSLSSAFAALSNTSVIDIFAKKFNNGKDVSIKDARLFVVIWGVLAILASTLCLLAGSTSLLGIALSFTSLFIGPLLAMFLMAFYRSSYNSSTVLFGVFGGVLILFLVSPPAFLNISSIISYKFSWPWNPLISLVSAFVISETVHNIKKMINSITGVNN